MGNRYDRNIETPQRVKGLAMSTPAPAAIDPRTVGRDHGTEARVAGKRGEATVPTGLSPPGRSAVARRVWPNATAC